MSRRPLHSPIAGRAGHIPLAAAPPQQARPASTYDAVMADIRAGRIAGLKSVICPVCQKHLRVGGACHEKSAGQFQSEHVLQMAVAEFLDRALPPDAFWTSIDSAGRGARDGAKMKRRGVKRGTADIVIMGLSWAKEGSADVTRPTIWLELKSATGRQTAQQKAFQEACAWAGDVYALCHTVEEVQFVLDEYGIPLRCRLSA